MSSCPGLPTYRSTVSTGRNHFLWEISDFSSLVSFTRYAQQPPCLPVRTEALLQCQGIPTMHALPLELKLRYRPDHASMVSADVFALLPGGLQGEVEVSVRSEDGRAVQRRELCFKNDSSRYPVEYRVLQLTDTMLRPNRELLVNDGRDLKLEFRVTFFSSEESQEGDGGGREEEAAVDLKEKLAVSAGPQLLSFMRSSECAERDFLLECGSGESVACSRILLRARSPIFNAMLGNDSTQESIEGRLKLPSSEDVDLESLRALVHFLYHDEFEGGPEMSGRLLQQLVGLAHKYDVRALLQECESLLHRQLSVENALATLTAADAYDLALLKRQCRSFVCLHLSELTSSAEWNEFLRCQPTLATEIIEAKVNQKA